MHAGRDTGRLSYRSRPSFQRKPPEFLAFGAADLCQVCVWTGVLRHETGEGAFLRSLPSRIYGQSWLSFDRMHNELMYSDEQDSM